MREALTKSDFKFTDQTDVYKGKVRDVYTIGEDLLVVVASDRISAFDHILPKGIPGKGQVLNQIASYFLENSRDICPNWLIACPDPSVSIGHKCEPVRIEMVIRGYLAGHAARQYNKGIRVLCGVELPENLKENDRLPSPIITPSVKALEGHDEDISREEILRNNIVPEDVYIKMEEYTRKLFQRGTELAAQKGLILVDTKYEFGIKDSEVYLIDEIHTPDSSRYFYLDGYEERQAKSAPQKQLSKEFVRQWLIENGFQGLENQKMPTMPNEFVQTVTERYVELYEIITGQTFIPEFNENITKRILKNVEEYLANNKMAHVNT